MINVKMEVYGRSEMKGSTVAILGASDQPERFAFKAFEMLKEYGHHPLPVHPKLKSIEGEPVYESLAEVSKAFPDPIDTLTLYVNPKISSSIKDEILQFNPKRVIFNPGTENDNLEQALNRAGIKTVRMCTLVLLQTGRF